MDFNCTEGPATGKVECNADRSTPNTIADVAAVLAAVLDRPNTYGRIIMMANGETPIAKAVAAV